MTKITEKVSVLVTGISQKEPTKYGIATGNAPNTVWYNGKGTCPCSKGDMVEIEYIQNGQWKNIVKVTGGTPKTDIGKMSIAKNEANQKMSALTNATNLCIARGENKSEQVLTQAKEFLDFLQN